MTDTFLHVLDSLEAEASGPSYSVPQLCDALARRGATVRLLTIGPSTPRPAWQHDGYPQNFAGVPFLRRLRFSRELDAAIMEAARSASVVHAHGLWLMPNIYPAQAAIKSNKPLIVSPRGMLRQAALRFSPRKKALFWRLAQARAVRAARCIHASSDQEYEDIRKLGLSAPVAIIPNGIEVPAVLPERSRPDGQRTALFLGRLHPIKGVELLIDAWARVAERHRDWRLEIVGPCDSEYARVLSARLANVPRARLAGPLYGSAKGEAYRQADIFVLPTMTENFAMTVAEALAQGTPVICSKGAPWAGLAKHGCGWWIDHDLEALTNTLDEALGMDAQRLASMGEAGRAWMAQEFNWNAVAASMEAVYLWLNEKGAKPSCVAEH